MARMHITCVVLDGSEPADGTLSRVPAEQPVTWPIGDAGELVLTVQDESGDVYDLTGKTLTVVCRQHMADIEPVFAVEAVNDEPGQGESPPGTTVATLATADTAAMVAGYVYWYDVRLDDDGEAQQVVPASKWTPGPVVARAGEPPASEEPTA
jgi:hypothetical protein